MAIKMNKYFALNVLFLLSLHFQFGIMLMHEKPVAAKLWTEPCNSHSHILNDCNWCWCNAQKRYTCHARVCNEVDMFGHFNDAIQELDVGMEGHGVWRTTKPACEPGVHYQRDELLCICTEDGNWPNPVCRDIFRVLHPVVVVKDVQAFKYQRCNPLKLYLIGCNVCVCPVDRVPNPKYCTRNTCSKDDPVFKGTETKITKTSEIVDVYAPCVLNKKYKVGCRHCTCLRNNRLLCHNCTNDVSHCYNRKPGEVFNIDCNVCQCNENNMMYCSVKQCLKSRDNSKYSFSFKLSSVRRPVNDLECSPGTKYQKDCNTCYCFQSYGIKKFGCTVKKCSEDDSIKDCVVGTSYEMDCLICHCGIYNGQKMQICYEDLRCRKKDIRGMKKLTELSGYCEPLHHYKSDCNTCECLPDGKTVRCTANICASAADPISVEIVPVVQDIGNCPVGRSFKINCNVCFCLSNNDVLCTTADCTN